MIYNHSRTQGSERDCPNLYFYWEICSHSQYAHNGRYSLFEMALFFAHLGHKLSGLDPKELEMSEFCQAVRSNVLASSLRIHSCSSSSRIIDYRHRCSKLGFLREMEPKPSVVL